MKKVIFLSLISVLIVSILSSCRPPELEGAFVDYGAGRIDKALELAKEATEKYPANPEAPFLLGKIYADKEQYDKMVEAFDESLNRGDAHKKEIQDLKNYHFQALFNEGAKKYNAYTKLEDRTSEKATKTLESAIDKFQNALLIKEDYKANELTAFCYTLLDKKEKALPHYKNMTEVQPDTAHAWISLANYYYNNSEYDKSNKNLKKAIEIDPDNEEAIALLAQTYDMQDQRDQAIKYYSKAIEVNPDEKAYPFNLGLLYIKATSSDTTLDQETKTDYYKQASKNFGKVTELDPEMKDPFKLKAQAEIQLKKFEEGLETANRALEYFPEDGELWFLKSVCLSNLNQKDDAEEAYERAKQLGYE
ncbi:MAG: tetratricopeptide repeat protein [Caldithrix sp.]|nr:tetratricopeptide repeat protein [Caldithrix sp.]